MSPIFEALTKSATSRTPAVAGENLRETSLATGARSPSGFRTLSISPGVRSRAIFYWDRHGEVAEQYRVLRRRLNVQFPQGAILLITSPGKGDGKSLNSLNLAWCLAEAEAPTLLVEMDLRRPSLAAALGVSVFRGVELALMGQVAATEVVGVVRGTFLHVAPVSKPQKEPVQVLRGVGTKLFLDWARQQFRWVILDAPPVTPVADVAEIAPFADGALLVVRARSTPRDLVQKAVEALNDQLRGVILNEANLCSDNYYHYLDQYYYEKSKNNKA